MHTAYHFQASGQVERTNRTINERTAKICTHIGLKWPEVLNLALWDTRNATRQPLGLLPTKVLFGRHLAIPGTYIPAKTSFLNGDECLTHYVLNLQGSCKMKREHAQWYQTISPEIQ